MELFRFISFLAVPGFILALLVILISRFEGYRRFLKYIPAALMLAAATGCFVKARWFSEGMEGLAYVVLAMAAAGCLVIALAVAVIIDLLRYRREKASR